MDQAPAWLVLRASEIPLVVDERLIVGSLQRPTIFLNVNKRARTGLRILGIALRHLFEKVLNQLIWNLGFLIAFFAFLRFALHLCGLLKHLFDLLFRERLASLTLHHLGRLHHLREELG